MLKSFAKYVCLNILGMIGLSCYILADTFFVSKALGVDGLASLNFSISVYCFIHGIGLMLGIGGATKYSICKSQNDDEKANQIFTHTLLLGVTISLIFVLLAITSVQTIAKIFGADGVVLSLTTTYLRTIMCFSPFFIFNNILLAFIRNDGSPRLAMCAMLIGSLSNILLDYLFIFPLSMGMFGAAFATGLAPIISIGVMSVYFIKKRNGFSLVRIKLYFKYFTTVISLGLSAFITEVASGIVLIVFNLVILRIAGNVGVAAYGVVANISLVVMSIFTGVAQGIQPLASRSYGEKDTDSLRKTLKYATTLSIAISTIVYALLIVGKDSIIAVFNNQNSHELASIASIGFCIYFVGFLFAGISIISSAYLSATANPKHAFVISITRGFIVIIPSVFILSALLGMNGVWMSFILAELIACIISVVFLKKIPSANNDSLRKQHKNKTQQF